MCGLVGVAGVSSGSADKAFKTLLMLDVIRGEHSTGVLIVGSRGSLDIHKKVGSPFELFDSRAFEEDIRYCNNVLMGHNRYATAGAVNKKNAHPFEHGSIIGAHNGTLTTQYLLDDNREYAVDSDNLYHHLSLNGVQETTKKLGGAYALTWWNSKNNTMNFLRNKERPLFYVFTEDKKNLLWASEYWMLQVAGDKAGIKLGKIEELPVASHYSIEIPLGTSATYPVLGDFNKEGVVEYQYPKQLPAKKKGGGRGNNSSNVLPIKSNQKYLGESSFEFTVVGAHETSKHVVVVSILEHPNISAQFNCAHGGSAHKKFLENRGNCVYEADIKRVIRKGGKTLIVFDKKTIREVFVEDDVVTTEVLSINGTYVTEMEFVSRTASGCSCCGETPLVEDHDTLTWVGDNSFLCAFCAEDERLAAYAVGHH